MSAKPATLSDRDITERDVAEYVDTTSVADGRAKVVLLGSYRFAKSKASAPPSALWQAEVLGKIRRYLELPQGWDSYNAQPVKLETGMFALLVLDSVMGDRTPTPDVVPSSVGGIQFEWHRNGVDLELHIAAPYSCEMWFNDHAQGQSVSKGLTTDFGALLAPIARLSTQ